MVARQDSHMALGGRPDKMTWQLFRSTIHGALQQPAVWSCAALHTSKQRCST
jgi:hypothetical protein